MKSFLSFLGVVFIVLVLAFGFAAFNGSKFDASSKKYADDNIPIIVGSWEPRELLKRASLELSNAASEDQITRLFSQFKGRLGSLVEYKGAKGDSKMLYTSQAGLVISASYKADAKFQRGEAIIDLTLIRRDGEWQISGFHLDLPL